MNNHPHRAYLIALDVGEKRIGVAIASKQSRIASPLTTVIRTEAVMHDLASLVDQNDVGLVVVGLPRGLEGQHTAQTMAVEEFKAALEHALSVPIHWQDEALTSRLAEAELRGRGKPYKKEDIDALSAVYILDDFMRDHPELCI